MQIGGWRILVWTHSKNIQHIACHWQISHKQALAKFAFEIIQTQSIEMLETRPEEVQRVFDSAIEVPKNIEHELDGTT